MTIKFWDRKRTILIEFLPQGKMVNTTQFCETLKKLKRAIQNKQTGMLTKGVCLLYNNDRPHTKFAIDTLLDSFG